MTSFGNTAIIMMRRDPRPGNRPCCRTSYQGDRAGFVIRAIAAVLDVVFVGIIVVLLWIGLWLFLLIFNPIIDPDLTVEVTPPSGYFLLAGYLLMWLYWTWMWATNGRLGSIPDGVAGGRTSRPSFRVEAGDAAVWVLCCLPSGVGVGDHQSTQ